MYEREKDLVDAFVRGGMSRRELMRRLGAMGMTAATAGVMVNAAATRALAQDFDWKAHEGTTVRLLLNQHPYADAMIANLDNFRALTGMDVQYDVFPEDVYFERVTAALSSGSTQYDAFMTGAYQTWTYGPANWIVDLNEYIQDGARVAPTWNRDDFLPGVYNSCAWSGEPGAPLGGEGAKQWCLPLAFEQNNVAYNRVMFENAGLEPPTNLDEMIERAVAVQQANPGIYGIGVRGSRSWATIHPGFLSAYANYGQRDLNVDGGRLSAAMNTDVSRQFHEKWVRMIREAGAANWATHTWYQVGNDLGAGQSAMIFDADVLGYFQNSGTAQAGNLGFHNFVPNPEAQQSTPNIWIWSMAMSQFSQQKDAAWYFLQWVTGPEHALFGAQEMDFVDPARQSVWADEAFQQKLATYPGYLEMFQAAEAGASIKFTPQPLFFDLTTEWAAMLQRMVANELPVDEGLAQLEESINGQLRDAGLG
jgi:multiple sugar transport system substrate-binding protein